MRIVAVHVEFGECAVRVVKRGRLHTGRKFGGTAAGDCELRAADVVLRTRRGVGPERVVDGDELMSKNVLPRSERRRDIDSPRRPVLNKLSHSPQSTSSAWVIRLRFVSHSSLERARDSLREINPGLVEESPTGVGSVERGTVTICTRGNVVQYGTHSVDPGVISCKTSLTD